MKQVLTEFIGSKKAIAFILGLLITLVAQLLQVDTEAVYQFVILTTAYIFGQGVADYGKAAEQVKHAFLGKSLDFIKTNQSLKNNRSDVPPQGAPQ